jgi:streptothricin acetyltransferase
MKRIVELPRGQVTDWSARDRTFTVDRELKLHLVNDVLSYESVAVTPSEKTYPSWQMSSAESVSFAVYIGTRIAAEIGLSKGWNAYAHIESLVVAQEFRRQGLARNLVQRAVVWAESQHFPGVMLETQNNNVPACQLYESCGFKLQGFDSSLYRGLKPHSQEVALFWYRKSQDQPPP